MSNLPELLPCPFCGSSPRLRPIARLLYAKSRVGMSFCVECVTCGIRKVGNGDYEAIESWNIRAVVPKLSAEILELVGRGIVEIRVNRFKETVSAFSKRTGIKPIALTALECGVELPSEEEAVAILGTMKDWKPWPHKYDTTQTVGYSRSQLEEIANHAVYLATEKNCFPKLFELIDEMTPAAPDPKGLVEALEAIEADSNDETSKRIARTALAEYRKGGRG